MDDSYTTIINSKFYGCSEECKNYNLYINEGKSLEIDNTQFKNAAGGVYIYNLQTCTINNAVFRDHDMALIDPSKSKYTGKYDNPGAMFGGAIYASRVKLFNVSNTQFINNAAKDQGILFYIF